MNENQVKRRLPAIEKSIAEIQPDKDFRVRLLGTIVAIKNGALVIDDGSGHAEVLFDETPGYINEGQLVRVVARVLPILDGFECRGECIQILDSFDINLYKRAKEITRGL